MCCSIAANYVRYLLAPCGNRTCPYCLYQLRLEQLKLKAENRATAEAGISNVRQADG
jgi:hypothetical protein